MEKIVIIGGIFLLIYLVLYYQTYLIKGKDGLSLKDRKRQGLHPYNKE